MLTEIMKKVTEETLRNAYKPYDIVTDKNGNVGFIQETNINEYQEEPHQISYSVVWMVGSGGKSAWFDHSELTKHCNIFVKIAECSCHSFGNNAGQVKILMGLGI